jgi:hypothetical protein
MATMLSFGIDATTHYIHIIFQKFDDFIVPLLRKDIERNRIKNTLEVNVYRFKMYIQTNLSYGKRSCLQDFLSQWRSGRDRFGIIVDGIAINNTVRCIGVVVIYLSRIRVQLKTATTIYKFNVSLSDFKLIFIVNKYVPEVGRHNKRRHNTNRRRIETSYRVHRMPHL